MAVELGRLIVPHLDGEVLDVSAPVEDLLLWLQPAAHDPHADRLDPGGVFAAGAEAIGVMRAALARTRPVGLLGADGRWQHVEVQVAAVPTTVLADYAAAVAVLDDGNGELVDDVHEFASGRGSTGAVLVGDAARFRDLVSLGWGGEQGVLAAPLARARAGHQRVVLSVAEDAAFMRLCEQFVAVWHGNDPLARYVYGLGFARQSRPASSRRRPLDKGVRLRRDEGLSR